MAAVASAAQRVRRWRIQVMGLQRIAAGGVDAPLSCGHAILSRENGGASLKYQDIVASTSSLTQDNKTEAFGEVSRLGELQLNVNFREVSNYSTTESHPCRMPKRVPWRQRRIPCRSSLWQRRHRLWWSLENARILFIDGDGTEPSLSVMAVKVDMVTCRAKVSSCAC